ncbi:MAG: VCBS repeat-containing protein [Verrucomicrobia bacterium]|nr:VCBS repeat-containing protein [Verrucomicrobiota bacterium]
MAIGAGKDANIYLVDRDNLGKYLRGAKSNTYIYQELANALSGGEFGTAAYFNGAVYYGPVGGELRRFTFTQARLNPSPAATTSIVFAYPGVTPSISSSGNNAGIVWAYENPSGGGQAVLHAYDAVNLIELYNSNQNPQRDQFGQANKFITPTICNGKVFVGTTNSVGVFGPLNSPPLPTPTPTPAPVPSPAPVAKDFNGDGYADLVWENTASGQHAIWFLKNGVPAGSISLAKTPVQWRIAGVGGINGNADPDLFWENTSNGKCSIWLLKNGVPVGTMSLPHMPVGWHIAGVGDFNNDGNADLVLENTATGKHAIWLLQNGVRTGVMPLPRTELNWHIAGVGDFKGDGNADLVWENTLTGQRSIWFLKSGVPVGSLSLPRMPLQWHIAGAGDFDGDGKADLVWENTATGKRAIWFLKDGVPVGSISLPRMPLQWHIVDH